MFVPFLNQRGHYNIGQQLCEATIKTTSQYPCTVGVNFNLESMNNVETYAKDICNNIICLRIIHCMWFLNNSKTLIIS